MLGAPATVLLLEVTRKRAYASATGYSESGLTEYRYAGNNFEIVSGDAFDTSMFVSGSFVTATPLPPNGNDLNPDLLAFSFNDGVSTIDSSSNPLVSAFRVWTNSVGAPEFWEIELFSGTGTQLGDLSPEVISSKVGERKDFPETIYGELDLGALSSCISISNTSDRCNGWSSSGNGASQAEVRENPGQWTVAPYTGS